MNDVAFLAVFPFLFIGMWVTVSLALGHFSGWHALQARFPDRIEEPLDRMRFQSAGLGKGKIWNPWGNVSYSNCLRIDVCPSGLRVALWRIFGINCRPFLVPWGKIRSEEVRFFFGRFVRLSFEDPNLSALTIRRRTFDRIRASGFLQS